MTQLKQQSRSPYMGPQMELEGNDAVQVGAVEAILDDWSDSEEEELPWGSWGDWESHPKKEGKEGKIKYTGIGFQKWTAVRFQNGI